MRDYSEDGTVGGRGTGLLDIVVVVVGAADEIVVLFDLGGLVGSELYGSSKVSCFS